MWLDTISPISHYILVHSQKQAILHKRDSWPSWCIWPVGHFSKHRIMWSKGCWARSPAWITTRAEGGCLTLSRPGGPRFVIFWEFPLPETAWAPKDQMLKPHVKEEPVSLQQCCRFGKGDAWTQKVTWCRLCGGDDRLWSNTFLPSSCPSRTPCWQTRPLSCLKS